MNRNIPLAGLLLIIAVGSWVYVTRPAVTPPAPKAPITQASTTSAALAMAADADKPDPPSKQDLKQLAVKIAHLRKTQKVVNGMVQIKPGQSGVVTLTWGAYGFVGTHENGNKYCIDGAPLSSEDTPNGSPWIDDTGYKATWTPASGLFSGVPTGLESSSATLSVLVEVPLGATGGAHGIVLSSLDNKAIDNNYYADGYSGSFTVTGPLTGSVSVTSQKYDASDNEVWAYLKASTSTGNKVVSAVIDWGDGSSDTMSPAPNAQSYTGSLSHVYTAEGDYTITVTYTDDVSPTPDSISPTAAIHICFPTSTEVTDFITAWGGFVMQPSLKITRNSTTYDATTGIYTNCYTVAIIANDGLIPVTRGNQGVWFGSANWGLPTGAVTSDDLTDNVGPISFCIASTTNNNSEILEGITLLTTLASGLCGSSFGLPLNIFTVDMGSPPSNGWWLFF